MKDKNKDKKKTIESKEPKKESSTDGFPVYSVTEDIYNRNIQEENIDPENLLQLKEPNQPIEYGNNLDVPGAELDDDQEVVGSEDEENNFYSIGGDEHNDLDEDNSRSTDELRKGSSVRAPIIQPNED